MRLLPRRTLFGVVRLTTVAAAVLGLALAGCASPTSHRSAPTREERVEQAFARMGKDIATKESLPSAPAVSFLLVDEDHLGDGSLRSLWTSNLPTSVRSRCFYLDVQLLGGAGAVSGFSGCGGGSDEVSLGGNQKSAVGDVGTWPAVQVRISTGGDSQVVPVKNSYFLVPEKFTPGDGSPMTLALLDAAGRAIGVVRDLAPPGSGKVQLPG
jgi:hypothetical protein